MIIVIIDIVPFATFPVRIHLFFLAEAIVQLLETVSCRRRELAAPCDCPGRTVRMALCKLNNVKHTADRRGRTVARPSCSSAEKLNRFNFNRTSGSCQNPSIPEFRAAGDKAELRVGDLWTICPLGAHVKKIDRAT